MKRWIVFGGSWYYPAGGGEDFISAHDELEVAVIAARDFAHSDSYMWSHVFDTQRHVVVSPFSNGD